MDKQLWTRAHNTHVYFEHPILAFTPSLLL